jgi:hypothetical protein
MKNIRLLSVLLIIMLSSCESEFLDREPLARVGDNVLFSSPEGAIQAVNACYDVMGRMELYRRLQFEIGDCISDDSEVGGKAGDYQHPASQDLSRFIATSDNQTSADYWIYSYRGIARCNDVIQQVPNIDMEESLQNRIIAEARFLRALYHFNLNNIYGGIPLAGHPLTQDEYYSLPRSTRYEVYQFIIEELRDLRQDLPEEYESADVGRATRGAANALLAKTYLFVATLKKYDQYIEWHGQGFDHENEVVAAEYFQMAKEAAELVMNGPYSLIEGSYTLYEGETYELEVPAFRWIFAIEGNNCSEMIFQVQHFDGHSGTGANYNEGNDIAKWCLVRDAIAMDGTPIPKPGFGFNCPTQDLVDEFEPEDHIRFSTTITTDEDSILWTHNDSIQWVMCDHRQSPTGYGQGKIRPLPNQLYGGGGTFPSTQSGFNVTILRLADVILIHAEACAELGLENEARNDLKMIRNRVSLSDYPQDPEYSNLLEAVRHERRCELALETHRWFDIVRWGKAAEELEGTAYGENFLEGTHEYLPIHSAEIMISNSIKQNKGY